MTTNQNEDLRLRTIPELARLLNKSVKQVRDYIDAGLPTEGRSEERGKAHLVRVSTAVSWLIDRAKATARPVDSEISDLKRRSALADAERKEYAAAEIKRRMVSIDEVAEFLDDRNAELVQHLRYLPNGEAILMALQLYNRNLRRDLKL
jgi:hypothetical protein